MAEDHLRAQARLSAVALLAIRRLWEQLGTGDFDTAWATLGPRVLAVLIAAQTAAARDAVLYVPAVLDELGIIAQPVAEVATPAIVGIASSGLPLRAVLNSPIITVRGGLASGMTMAQARTSGGSVLDGIVRTQVSDAGRTAESVAIAVRPEVTGYVRMLRTPSCGRCAILAGRHYRWSAGFLRHPVCDCRMIPATENIAGDLTTDPRKAFEAGQIRGLSRADAQAIADGADIGRVVNARSGMQTAQVFGQKVKTTTAGVRKGQAIRLRPESIYRQANGNRDEALRLLTAHGYIR